MKIRARGIDPFTGEPDPHGIPQIACPARLDDVNPQFTCRTCPCAGETETHQAVDDLGQPFYIVDAVECTHDGISRALPAVWREFPSLLAGVVENAPPLVAPGVPCPLLALPARSAPVSLVLEGVVWAPVGGCGTCQFHRGVEGVRTAPSPGENAGVALVCAAPR